MFSGLTNQVSSWMGQAKGEPQDEEVPTPTKEALDSGAATATATEGEKTQSATGGADSGPASPAGTPTEEQAGQIGNVTHKAVAGAKSFGSFLYSAVNKAGAKVSEAGAKIKKTVEENSLLGEFNKEQDAFIRGQAGGKGPAELPWAGRDDEAALKEECLSLSTDRRNFVRAPPAGVEFNFDYDTSYPVAVAIMAEDPNLEKMRYDLVPIAITEENFWRNYFYRVSLICQFIEASEENNESLPASRLTSVDEPQDGVVTISPTRVLQDLDADFKSAEPAAVDIKKSSSENILQDSGPVKGVTKTQSEQLLDAERKSVIASEGIGERVKSLAIDRNNQEEEEWETELEAELRDYEVLSGDKAATASTDDKQWEKECHDLLGDDDDDLK